MPSNRERAREVRRKFEGLMDPEPADDLESAVTALLDAKDRDVEESQVFTPMWPPGLEAGKFHRVPCDDKGRNGGSWMQVMVAPQDGDVYVSMQDWEDMPEGHPSTFPSIRNRTVFGGGRNSRTHQALLWLARAIQLDNEDAQKRGGHS